MDYWRIQALLGSVLFPQRYLHIGAISGAVLTHGLVSFGKIRCLQIGYRRLLIGCVVMGLGNLSSYVPRQNSLRRTPAQA